MPSHRNWPLLALLLLALGTHRAQAQYPPADPVTWPGCISIFYRGANWETDEDAAQAYATAVREAHFGGLMESLDRLELCREHELKLLVINDWEEGEVVQQAPELIDDPAILGYYISDHRPPEDIPLLAEWEQRYRAADPRHPALFTTEPGWSHYGEFIEAVQPRVVDFYYYQWQYGRDGGAPAHHFEQIEYYRDFARQLGGVPLTRWIHVDPQVVKMRQSVTMSLVYGVRGFRWWVGWTMFDLNERDDRGVPLRTPIGEEVAQLNRAIAACSPVFASGRHVGAWHTAPLPAATQAVPADHWFQLTGDELAVGEFESDDSGQRYLIIANRDIEAEHTATLTFREPISAVALCDFATGDWEETALETAGGASTLSLTLPAAGGRLVRVSVP